MLTDVVLFLPLCAVAAVMYQVTRGEDLATLVARSLRTFLHWTAGMAVLTAAVLLVSWFL